MKKIQILAAYELGKISFYEGLKAPCQDQILMDMISDRDIGQTQHLEATSIDIMKSWIKGHTAANLSNNII